MFFISTVLFPLFILNKLFFVSAFTLIFYKIKENSTLPTLAPFIVFLVFFYGFVISFFGNVYRPLTNQLMLSVAVLFLIYPIDKYAIEMNQIVKVSGIILTSFTYLFFFIAPISPLAYSIFTDYGSGSSGFRGFTGEASISFHFGTVPFLFLPFCLFFYSYLKEKKKINIIAILFLTPAIFLGTSRGLWLICVLGLFFMFFLNLKLPAKLIMIGISIPIFISVATYLSNNTNAFSSDEESNSVKIGHIISFFDNLNFINFFTGDGLGAYYFSKGVGGLKANTEVTPIDMLRYFGFILTPILYTVIIFPIKKLGGYTGENKFFTVIFIIYLINSFTNPIMFNSYGLLIVLWYWSKILNNPNLPAAITTQKKVAYT